MRRKLMLSFCAVVLLSSMTGCSALHHNIGAGAPGGATTVASKRQWYILWGLVPINKVDGGQMAKEKGVTTDYTVYSRTNVLDFILNMVTYIITVSGQTVSVSGTPGSIAAPSARPVLSSADSIAKGNQAMSLKDYNSALQDYQAAVAADPNNAAAYQGLGTCHYYLGQKAEAIKAFEKSLSLNPANAQLSNFLKTLKQ